RFQWAIAGAGDGATVAAVVEQRVDRFLQHSFFVANNDVRRFQLKQIFETIVAVDDAAIEIVQIGCRESSAFERNQRTQIRRDHRQHIEDHPIRPRVRRHEALAKFQTLRQFFANLFRLRRAHRLFQLFVELVQVDLGQKFLNRFRAHAGGEIFAVLFLRFAILDFVKQLRARQRGLARIDDDVVFVVNDALELACAHVEHQTNARRHALVEPNVRNRNGELDVAHAFAANTRERDFDAATIADDAFMFDAFVFSAGAFPVACRTENTFAEKASLFRFEGAVIDRLGIFDFAFAPRSHGVAARDANRDLIKTYRPFFTY